MTRKGQGEVALGAGLVFSAIGGMLGTVVLVMAAPALAEFALNFSSFEYFWLVCLGLTCAVFVASEVAAQGAAVAHDRTAGRLHRNGESRRPIRALPSASPRLTAAIEFIPAMIGLVCDLRDPAHDEPAESEPAAGPDAESAHCLQGRWKLAKRYPKQWLRGSAIGTLIGALPGAGCDIAAWVTYATSKRFSKEPEKFGTGHVEGIIESGAANNAAVSGTWIPALVFGIPGDTITAIVIGVLYLKKLVPGPLIFQNQPEVITALFAVFFLANLLMLPLGWVAIKFVRADAARLAFHSDADHPALLHHWRIRHHQQRLCHRRDAGIRHPGLRAGRARFPVAPIILGIVLGPLLEQNFFSSHAQGQTDRYLHFFRRPIAGVLGVRDVTALGAMVCILDTQPAS